jgi:hypothetical protein
MSKRMTCLLTLGILALPLPAYADCAERIAAVESHPALAGQDSSRAERPAKPATGSDEKVVEEEMVENGDAIRENGGETVHADGGPATPQESWFSEPTERSAVLTHLDAARQAQSAGDEKACLESVQQAETALEDGTG